MIGYYHRIKRYSILISDHKVIKCRTVIFIEDKISDNEIIIVSPEQLENDEEETYKELSQKDSNITKNQKHLKKSIKRNRLKKLSFLGKISNKRTKRKGFPQILQK